MTEDKKDPGSACIEKLVGDILWLLGHLVFACRYTEREFKIMFSISCQFHYSPSFSVSLILRALFIHGEKGLVLYSAIHFCIAVSAPWYKWVALIKPTYIMQLPPPPKKWLDISGKSEAGKIGRQAWLKSETDDLNLTA